MQKSQAYGQRLLRGQTPTYERLQQRLAEDGQAELRTRQLQRRNWRDLQVDDS